MMTRPEPTSNGQPIADETIERLADQAEDGYDPKRLKRTVGRPPIGSAASRIVPVRLDPELDEALRLRAETDHTNTSAVIREALRA